MKGKREGASPEASSRIVFVCSDLKKDLDGVVGTVRIKQLIIRRRGPGNY